MDNKKNRKPPPLRPALAASKLEADDAWLAQQAQAGCAVSFERLVERHTPRLLRFLQWRTGHPHDAEDLAQETWSRAYRFLRHYRVGQSFPAWLWTIAIRLDVNRRRKKTLPFAPWHDDLVSVPGDAGRGLIEQERRDGLWALARRRLSAVQHDALWLFYVEEMSLKEVAHILNVSVVSAKVILYRARRRLGDALRQDGVAEASLMGCWEGAAI